LGVWIGWEMDGGDGINEGDGGEYERVNMALMRVGLGEV
jgi:hypothetical protein